MQQEHTLTASTPSKVVWQNLEQFARHGIQEFIQRLLEEEMTGLLGREKSQRLPSQQEQGAEPATNPPPYRNGYGKPRQLSTSMGTVTVRRPRVRNLTERFESRILPLFARRTQEVGELLPQLYLHGLAEGDFDLALRGLLGEAAPLSASSLSRLKEVWQQEYEAWRSRSLHDLDVVYLFVDGIYVKAGLEKEKAALLVVIAALADGSKAVVAVECGVRESVESWSGVLRRLKAQGMNGPKLVVGDGNLGLWGALANVYPEAREQRCWNHRMMNVLDRLPKKWQGHGKVFLQEMMYAATQEKAEAVKGQFQEWCRLKGLATVGAMLEEDWERMVTFFSFPKEHWVHLRTTNIVESPFAAVRLRTGAAKRYKKVENATAVIWKTLMIAEKRFRKLNAPHLLAEVAAGAVYKDGVRVTVTERVAA